MDLSMFANMPLMAPPAGQQSNFDAPAHDATTVWVITLITMSMAFLAVTMRFLVKLFVSKQKLSWDDGACLLALCTGIAHTCVIFKDLQYGLGKKMWNVRVSSVTHDHLLLMTAANFIICLNMLFVRISILALYQQLFGIYDRSKKLIILGYFIVVLVALPELGVAVGRMKLCSNAMAGVTLKYCFTKSVSIAVITFAVVGVLMDVYIYSIAIFRLRALHISKKKKIQLGVVFGFGLIALVFGICNLIFCTVYFQTKQQLWFALWVALFKILEANIALICACATFLPALWKAAKAAKPSGSSSGSKLSINSKTLSQDQNSSVKSSTRKGRDSDEELVLKPLKPVIYVEREHTVHHYNV